MKIAIASGKGGTGKTTLSVNLYRVLSQKFNNNVQLIDCDVEEPNAALFFPNLKLVEEKQVFTPVPEIDAEQCTFCKKCANWCEFNAISIIPKLSFAEINSDLCHSCGACLEACQNNAISEKNEPLGTINSFKNNFGVGIVEGRLEIGSAMQTALIKKVKQIAENNVAITLYDAPPGTSCPVIETIADTDYILLITEPTPFGLNDLKIAIELISELKIPFGVIVNKAGIGNNDVYDFLEENNIELIAKLPFSKNYATQYSNGNLLEDIPFEIDEIYQKIAKKIIDKVPAKL